MNACDPVLASSAAGAAAATLNPARAALPVAFKRSHRRIDPPISWSGVILVTDVAAMVMALLAVAAVTKLRASPGALQSLLSLQVSVKMVAVLAAALLVWPAILTTAGLYTRSRLRTWQDEARRTLIACTAAAALAVVFPLTSRQPLPPMAYARFSLGFWSLAVCLLLAFRCVRRLIVRSQTHDPRRVIIVGAGPRGQATFDELLSARPAMYNVLGFVDTSVETAGSERARRLGTLADLESIVMHQPVDEVFITLPVGSCYRDIQQIIGTCERAGVPVKYRADIFDTTVAWPEYERSPVVTMQVAPTDARLLVKRATDVAGAAAGIVLLAPVMAVIALVIRFSSPGPVFFAQERYGRNKRIFRMLKFRTMVSDAARLQDALEARNEMDGPVFKIRNDPRITPFGRFLRRTSLDELPQLFQVLTGEMSLVGPRPLPLRDVARFTRPSDMRRFSVRPGLTCLWQISGRNDVGFDEWVRLDLAYIDAWSPALDLYILLKTLPAVLRGAGAR